jgi:putative transposase
MPNHFHLLLREKKIGGIGKFMQRLGGSITMGFNMKYKNQGSIFQAKYKPILVLNDSHLYHLVPYINVKNVMELYPEGGLNRAFSEFDNAWE